MCDQLRVRFVKLAQMLVVSCMVISPKHLPRVTLSHVSTKYMQGHQDKKKPEVKVQSLLSKRGQWRRCHVHNLRTNPSTRWGWGLVVQRPSNCNRSCFIVVSGSLNNTLYLWSRARQSGIVWEVLRSWHTQRGIAGQLVVILDRFHHRSQSKMRFFLKVQIVSKSF